jgi:hypothetical protein
LKVVFLEDIVVVNEYPKVLILLICVRRKDHIL